MSVTRNACDSFTSPQFEVSGLINGGRNCEN